MILPAESQLRGFNKIEHSCVSVWLAALNTSSGSGFLKCVSSGANWMDKQVVRGILWQYLRLWRYEGQKVSLPEASDSGCVTILREVLVT